VGALQGSLIDFAFAAKPVRALSAASGAEMLLKRRGARAVWSEATEELGSPYARSYRLFPD